MFVTLFKASLQCSKNVLALLLIPANAPIFGPQLGVGQNPSAPISGPCRLNCNEQLIFVSAQRSEVFSPRSNSFRACLCSPADEPASTPPERGLFHIWESAGPSVQLCPERVLLSIPVVQAALGEHHGVLLVQGECVKHGCIDRRDLTILKFHNTVIGTKLVTVIITVAFYFEENNTPSVLSQTYKYALRWQLSAVLGKDRFNWSRCRRL